MVLEIFGTLIKSVWFLLKEHSLLSGVIHSIENEEIVGLTQGCADGEGVGGIATPKISNLQESLSKVSQAARGLATLF